LNWKRELEKWLTRQMSIEIANGKTLGMSDIVIINYDILKKHSTFLRSKTWDILIVDESHYIKNPKALRTVEVLGKRDRDPEKVIQPIPSRKVLFMTGTPILNRPIELWPILRYTGTPWTNWKNYVERYCNGYQTKYGWNVSGASNLGELQEKLRSSLMIRRLKKDVLPELPAKRRQVIEIPGNDASGIIEEEQTEFARNKERLSSLQAAVQLAKASEGEEDYKKAVQALRGGYQAMFVEMSLIRHKLAVAKVPYLAEMILDTLESVDKLIVFLHHRDAIQELRKWLEGKGVKVVLLIGDQSSEERQKSVDSFQNDPEVKVFIGSIMAAGVGITLTAASHVIFGELDWVPGNITQAEDRCHRIGQSESVLIQHVVFEGSLDVEIAKRIVEKQDIIDKALDKNSREIITENDSPIYNSLWGSLIEMKNKPIFN